MNSVKHKAGSRRGSFLYGVIGALLIGVSGAYFLHRYPIRIPVSADAEKAASFVLKNDGAQVTLLVDTSVIRQNWAHKTLSRADFSYGWTNVLQQEFGYFDIREISAVDSASLAEYRIVVYSESALKGLAETPAMTKQLVEYVSAGGMAVLDYPSNEIIDWFGLASKKNRDERQRLSRLELGLFLGKDLNARADGGIPDSLPVFSTIRNYGSVASGASIEIQSNSCFEYFNYGAGGMLLTKWDFGRWVTLTQQGLPDENLNTVNRYADLGHSDKLEANDLVADSSYLNSVYPWVDIVEKTLGNLIAAKTFAPRWHTTPGASSGIFMMTHDDEALGDVGAWMNVYESQFGYTSTSFLMPSEKLSSAGVSAVTSNGGEVGLHWNRFDRDDKASLETLGIGRWRPLVRRRNLSSQIAWLDSLDVKTSYNRNHYFLWDKDPYRLFRNLNAAGFTMDYSYGPDLNDKGYLFGSAFPFYPLDDNGASFELTETPVTWGENFNGADSAWIARLLENNASDYHGVINALYHNNTFAWAPDYSIYESWRLSYELAQGSRHVMYTASQLEQFITARSTSPINWEIDSESVEVYCDATQPDLALIVPMLDLYRPTISIHDAGMSLSEVSVIVDSVSVMDSAYWRIVFPKGKYLLSFERSSTSREEGG